MRSRESIFRMCFRGIYSCYWTHSRESKQRCVCFWFSFLILVSFLSLGWMYICFIAYNEHNDVNWKAFQSLSLWVNWFMCVVILSAVVATYCILLLLFSLFQFAIKEPLDLHWLHKVFLFLGLIIVVFGIAIISYKWEEEWDSIRLSLEATAPFLQLGGVVALTLVSWLVFQSYHRAQHAVSKALIIGTFVAVSVAIFLSPLSIHSPCLTDTLPPKPALIGHRGAPMLAPENTIMSFNKSLECKVTAFETDVQLSKDNEPFLMHDHGKNFLKRTTNVDVVFPNLTYNTSSEIAMEDLRKLNAGDWFLKMDPFWSTSWLSEHDKAKARNQTVPSFTELLTLAKANNISIIFDLKNGEKDCNHTVDTILRFNISHDLIWLPSECSEGVKKHGFRQVHRSDSNIKNGNVLNMKYSNLSTERIRNLTSKNVTVNLWVVNERWLFSLLWCAGASSVTTNNCHILKDMSQPDWHLTKCMYLIIWIAADLVSLILMILLFFLQRMWKSRNQNFHLESERTVPLLRIKPHILQFE